MPSLTVKKPNGVEVHVPLVKRNTSVGREPDNDVVIDDPAVPATAFRVEYDGTAYRLFVTDAPVTVNGKKKSEATLAMGDVIGVGGSEIRLSESQPPLRSSSPVPSPAAGTPEPGPSGTLDPSAMNKLVVFSQKLLARYELDPLLETMMDQVIELTRADKGFLILFEAHEPRIKVARNLKQENLDDAISRISDSIIATVLKTRKPLIVSDAINDPSFAKAESVVNLKLLSVMCAPLTEKGEVFGLIYVGNDSVRSQFEQKSLDLLTIWSAQASLILRNAMLVNELRVDNAELRKQLEVERYGEIIGACSSMKEVYKKIDKVSTTDISVLITGETGTGKELIAREIHKRSPRAKGPFVTINCGAIPENLLESELFGHVRGAFTGAVATRQGRFQAANGGTLFLDEIGEMPVQLQVKILRALQERQVQKVGDSRSENVDIRVVAATNRNLEEEIKRGSFREDLYYRLNVVTLKMPPLRDRGEDIQVMAKFFLTKYAREFNSKARGFTPSASIGMKKYGWPGNVRELENRIKKAVVMADKALVSGEDMDLRPENLEPPLPLADALERYRKSYINDILERNNGNRTKTAKDLGVDPRTIFRHLEKLEAERTGKPLPPEEPGEETPPEPMA
ncbi:MAG TPA: sigma 54-interacting transcriptional regulator [Myxococcales bacterium]|jgi:transcriptional regulator with GAF, ATPase, and Fis domain